MATGEPMTPPLSEKMIEAGAKAMKKARSDRMGLPHRFNPADQPCNGDMDEAAAAYLAMRSHPDNPDRVLVEALKKIAAGDYDLLAGNPGRWPNVIAQEALAAAQQEGE